MAQIDSPQRDGDRDPVAEFLAEAHKAGFLSSELADFLCNFRLAQLAVPVSPPEPLPESEPKAHKPQPAEVSPLSRTVAPADDKLTPPPSAAPVSPASSLPQPSAQPEPSPHPVPRKRPSRAEVWARFARMRSRRLWGAFTADFAANALTYLGVLLSVVVIYVFFAFGYFGETIDEQHKHFRPLVEAGVVVFFLGLAWLLRHRSGIPQTATAIEIIGIILIPIMISASFRDGCTPDYRPWCLPPDVDGPGRWSAYGVAGLISTVIYYGYARRRTIYAYLIGPMLWTSLGAFALYLEDGLPLLRRGDLWTLDRFAQDGISAPQLIAVLIAIWVSIAVVTRYRHGRLGELLAVPVVRSGVFFTPFVLALSLVFSYNDAVARGIASPTLADLVWPNIIATFVAAAIFALSANAGFVWEELGRRSRRDAVLVLQIAAYLSLAASWLLTAGFGVSPAWLGAGLVGYAVVIALIDQFFVGSDVAAIWIVRTALAVAGALSLLAPGATIATWGFVGVIAALCSFLPALATHVNRFVPEPAGEDERRLARAVPLVVAVGAGATRMGWPDATPLVLLAAAVVFAATRLLPERVGDIRLFAAWPAVAAGFGAAGVEVWRQIEGIGFAGYQLSGFLAALAVLAALVEFPVPVRSGAVVGFAGAAAMVAMREYLGTEAWETAWIDTLILAGFGIALVASSMAGSRYVLFNGALGHALVVAATGRSLMFEETAIVGLGVLAAVHMAEAASVEFGRDCLTSRLARNNTLGIAVPTLVATTALAPLTILVGRQVPIIVAERPRFGPVLAVLSWIYFVGAMQQIARARRIAVPFAYGAALVAIAVSAPSMMAMNVTAASATVVTAALAIRLSRPHAMLVSWLLAVATLLLWAYRMGVPGPDLALVLHVTATLLVVGSAIRNWPRRATGGLESQWLVPPVYLGMLLLTVSLAMTIADGRWIAWVALSSAASFTILGVATRAGGVAIQVATTLAIGYAAVLYDNEWAHPFDQPLVWLPLSAGLIGAASLLPGNRRWRILLDPAPGLVVSGLGLGALSAAYSHGAGVLDISLVGCSILLAAVALIRREEPWLVASGIVLIAAGLVAGDHWAPLATLASATLTANLADRKRDTTAAMPLRAATTIGIFATFGLTGVWLDWTAAELIAISGVNGGVLVTTAVILTIASSWHDRIRVWMASLHFLGHGLVLTALIAAIGGLSGVAPFGVAALLVLLEAVATGVIGTVRRWDAAIAGSAGLFAAAYGLLGLWQNWTPTQAVAYTAAIGAVLSAGAAIGFLTSRLPLRAELWLAAVLGVGQIALVSSIAMAVEAFSPSAAAGISVAILSFESSLAGIAGTTRCDRVLVAASAVVAAIAYGTVPQWLLLSRSEFLGVTAILVGVLAVVSTSITEKGRGRLALWAAPLHGLTFAGVVSIVVKALEVAPDGQTLWTLAAVAFGLGCYAGVNAAAVPAEWGLRSIAVALTIASAALVLAAEVVRDGEIFAAMLGIAGLGVVTAVAAGLLAGTDSPWRREVGSLGLGLLVLPVVANLFVFPAPGAELGTLLIVAGSGLAAYGLLSHELLVIEAALVVWLGALMILVNERMELTLHAAVIISSVTLLATVELERHRRHLSEQEIPDGLHHLEWVLMLAPLVLAVAGMFESLWFGLTLFVEGLLLTAWGIMSEVRRRALLGVGAIVSAIILSAVIPALHGANAGLTGGTWLTIGAVTATVFILAGSAIERRRHAIGRRLAYIAEILEHWE